MGQEKHNAEIDRTAEMVLIRAGIARPCATHEHILVNTWTAELQSAYAIGTNLIKQGKIACSREALMDAIKRVHGLLSERCEECAARNTL